MDGASVLGQKDTFYDDLIEEVVDLLLVVEHPPADSGAGWADADVPLGNGGGIGCHEWINLDTGEPFTGHPLSANAYLGARGIVAPSAFSASPMNTQTKLSCSTTGQIFSRAVRGTRVWPGTATQPPSAQIWPPSPCAVTFTPSTVVPR